MSIPRFAKNCSWHALCSGWIDMCWKASSRVLHFLYICGPLCRFSQNTIDLMHNDVPRPQKAVWELQPHSNPRWRPVVQEVGETVIARSKVKQIATRRPSHIRTHVGITKNLNFRLGKIRRHIGFVRNYNVYNVRSRPESIV